MGNDVALVEIEDAAKRTVVKRIKKLSKSGKSKIISFKAEKSIANPIVRVLNILSEENALSRTSTEHDSIRHFTPKYTNKGEGGTPIYVFDSGESVIIGGYYKKDIEAKTKIAFNDADLSAIGLYMAEGGKTAASFTNSWPAAINPILDFFENNFGMKRNDVRASICCNHIQKEKKRELESFWECKTGIKHFARSLHFNKNVRSPQGILELYFCSEVLKEIMLSIMDFVSSHEINKMPLIRGILSGDGHPMQENKFVLNHHITFDQKSKILLDRVFSGFNSREIRTQPRKIISTTWEDNKRLLFLDPYRFNLRNRVRFAHRFLLLPRTLRTQDDELAGFKEKEYPKLLGSLLNHFVELNEFGLTDKKKIEEAENEYLLHRSAHS
jgi:hypothetical protein